MLKGLNIPQSKPGRFRSANNQKNPVCPYCYTVHDAEELSKTKGYREFEVKERVHQMFNVLFSASVKCPKCNKKFVLYSNMVYTTKEDNYYKYNDDDDIVEEPPF